MLIPPPLTASQLVGELGSICVPALPVQWGCCPAAAAAAGSSHSSREEPGSLQPLGLEDMMDKS